MKIKHSLDFFKTNDIDHEYAEMIAAGKLVIFIIVILSQIIQESFRRKILFRKRRK